MVRFDLDPTVPRVFIIAILLLCESILIPIYAILQQNRYPTALEMATFVVGAILTLVTFLMTFIRTGSEEPKPT